MKVSKIYANAALAATIAVATTTTVVTAKMHHNKASHKMDIVDTAVKSGQFKTLVTAVKSAGLVGTLKGKGPFTVFAPTDAAFARLPRGTVQSLLKDKAALTNILTYHVVAGNQKSAKVVQRKYLMGLNKKPLYIQMGNGKPRIGNAYIVKTDIMAKNGVIHVIDAVLMPPK